MMIIRNLSKSCLGRGVRSRIPKTCTRYLYGALHLRICSVQIMET